MRGENGIDNFATVVDAEGGRVLAQENLTFYQSEPRGLVFERINPQPNDRPGVVGGGVRPYVQRTLQPFRGSATASPRGWVSGNTTAGNNVVAGHNPLGVVFLSNPASPTAVNGDFSFPLDLGPGAPNPANYWAAATTNLFYWANRSHDFFYAIGFDEAAGNFQQENYGGKGEGGDPMRAYSQYGAANPGSYAALNNAFFTTSRSGTDGSQVSINIYIGGSRAPAVFADGSYDGEVIIHEYAHGVSNRLVRQLSSLHGGAMGEGWSDFFSLEATLPEGAPPDGVYPQGEYLFQAFDTGIRTRPYSTNMDVNPLTFAALGNVSASGPEVHADGEIWVQALWEMRAALIAQFGETEGRRRVRLLAIDGMKLSTPAPTMLDMRDAILLADRVDFAGASQSQIWEAFARRGMGVLAYCSGPSSIHIAASDAVPAPAGAIRFVEEQYTLGETVRIVLQDANNQDSSAKIQLVTSSGDLETLKLTRAGSVFTGAIASRSSGVVNKGNGVLEVVPNDFISAYYTDENTGGGQAGQISAAVPTKTEYTVTFGGSQAPIVSGTERTLFAIPGSTRLAGYGLATKVSLPFEFPLFDQKYWNMWVYGDGLLTFGQRDISSCWDAASLTLDSAVAPMWMQLAYGGSTQPSQNVYMSSGSDSVTIRWAGETQPVLSTGVTPEAVNFRATLYNDGRVVMQYGSGNRFLANSALFAPGCPSFAPTVGISPGHETYVWTSSTNGNKPNLENAPTLTFYPPYGFASIPAGILESPAAGESVKGILTVKGVAYDDKTSIQRIDVIIDGIARGVTSRGLARPDFCATQKVTGCPNVGFQAVYNVESLGLEPGAHSIQLRVTNYRGAVAEFPEQPVQFVVEAGQSRLPTGAIEAPAEGAELSGTVVVKGYAFAGDLRVLYADILVDGVSYGSASFTQRRDDICTSLAVSPNCPNVGFSFNLNTLSGTVQLPNGPHTLQARVRDELGRYTLVGAPLNITVNNPANKPPQGVLTAPQPNATLSGTVTISGYAWDPDGRVNSVVVLLDGATLATLRYGLPRPEECAQLPEAGACPNIGFEGTLDTRGIANGPHVMGIRVTDDKGGSTITPVLARYGMNVIIRN